MRTRFTACFNVLTLFIGLAVIAGFCGKADAAGFAIYEWGARGNALGGAMVAKANDPSAVAWNPAGITQLKGTHISAGVAMISPMMDLSTTYNGVTTKNSGTKNVFFPANAYITHQINDNVWLGVGAFTRYGLGTEFSEDWYGRYASYKTSIETSLIQRLFRTIRIDVFYHGKKHILPKRKDIAPSIAAHKIPGVRCRSISL